MLENSKKIDWKFGFCLDLEFLKSCKNPYKILANFEKMKFQFTKTLKRFIDFEQIVQKSSKILPYRSRRANSKIVTY